MALLRARHADRSVTALKRAVAEKLQRAARELAASVRSSGEFRVSKAFKAKLTRDLIAAMRRPMIAMAVHGFALAGHETKTIGKSRVAAVHGKAFENGVGFSEDRAAFVQANNWPNLEKWVSSTAESANNTFGARMLSIFQEAADTRDPETGRGLTPRDIADQLLSAGLDLSEERASMLARTGSIWAYNEGAVERYAADGVEVVEWLTADDDMTCPFCAEMNGKRVETQESFFSNGDKMQVGEETMQFKRFDIKHPPLHPNCRCTLIPVVDEAQL